MHGSSEPAMKRTGSSGFESFHPSDEYVSIIRSKRPMKPLHVKQYPQSGSALYERTFSLSVESHALGPSEENLLLNPSKAIFWIRAGRCLSPLSAAIIFASIFPAPAAGFLLGLPQTTSPSMCLSYLFVNERTARDPMLWPKRYTGQPGNISLACSLTVSTSLTTASWPPLSKYPRSSADLTDAPWPL